MELELGCLSAVFTRYQCHILNCSIFYYSTMIHSKTFVLKSFKFFHEFLHKNLNEFFIYNHIICFITNNRTFRKIIYNAKYIFFLGV